MYVCKMDFCIPFFNENGFEDDSRESIVKKGERFRKSEDSYRFIGGQVRLESEDGTQWIEISKERFEKFFQKEKEKVQ